MLLVAASTVVRGELLRHLPHRRCNLPPLRRYQQEAARTHANFHLMEAVTTEDLDLFSPCARLGPTALTVGLAIAAR